MSWGCRRLVSGGLAAVVVPLLLVAPGVAAAQVRSTGVVPNVVGWNEDSAVAAVQAAGFVAQTVPGWVDCSSFPFVQTERPGGGTSAPLGSTVTLEINQQPGPGGICP